MASDAVMQSDLRELLVALDMGDHARPQSPHEVFQEALAEVRRVKAKIAIDASKGWRADCFRTRMAEFDAAYAKACGSSQPKDWMDAALLAQQFRNVAYAVLVGEAPKQEAPSVSSGRPRWQNDFRYCD